MAASSSLNTRSRHNSPSQNSAALQLTNTARDPTPSRTSPYHITEAYETKLRSIKNGALLVACLQKVSRFFGICALTWATVVLLGGFAAALRPLDFYLISILLLLEAFRLSTTQVFIKLLSKTLFRERHRPEEFEFKDLQYFWASRLDLVGQGSSGSVAIVGLALAAARFGISAHHPFTERDESSKGQSGNLTPALYAFYVLVILNSTTAIASGICRLFIRCSSEDSLMSYHDEVYRTAMNVGVPEADEIEILDFAFKKLANDHMRNVRPLTIKKRNKDLISYIYNSPNGVEVTCEYLKSGDVWKQVVAGNLAGFWVEESRIQKQVGLFWALQDRLYSTGKVAEAAANSIQCLSKAWAEKPDQHPFLIRDPSKIYAANLVDTLIDLVIDPIRSSLLFQLRALEGCCRSRLVVQHIYNSQSNVQCDGLRQELQDMIAGKENADQHDAQPSRAKKLCQKLQSIVNLKPSSPRQTTKMYAASTLHALLCFEGELDGDAKESLKSMVEDHIHPAKFMGFRKDGKGEYVWQDEKIMLDKLRESLGLSTYEHWDCVRVVPPPDGEDKPATSSTCWPV